MRLVNGQVLHKIGGPKVRVAQSPGLISHSPGASTIKLHSNTRRGRRSATLFGVDTISPSLELSDLVVNLDFALVLARPKAQPQPQPPSSAWSYRCLPLASSLLHCLSVSRDCYIFFFYPFLTSFCHAAAASYYFARYFTLHPSTPCLFQLSRQSVPSLHNDSKYGNVTRPNYLQQDRLSIGLCVHRLSVLCASFVHPATSPLWPSTNTVHEETNIVSSSLDQEQAEVVSLECFVA